MYEQHKDIVKTSRKLEATILNTTTKIETAALAARLNSFSELEHMSYLKDVLIPRIEHFSKKL